MMQSEAAAARQKWEGRYGADDYEPLRDPSEFLTQSASGLSPGRALCLAAGGGRNAVWLATAGWQVTAVDISPRGLAWCEQLAGAHGVQIETVVADLSTHELGSQAWDLITMIFFYDPALFPAIREALTPGGHFLLHTFSQGQIAQDWGPSSPTHLARPEDVHSGFGD